MRIERKIIPRGAKVPVRDNDKAKIAALEEDVRHLERKRDELWAELELVKAQRDALRRCLAEQTEDEHELEGSTMPTTDRTLH